MDIEARHEYIAEWGNAELSACATYLTQCVLPYSNDGVYEKQTAWSAAFNVTGPKKLSKSARRAKRAYAKLSDTGLHDGYWSPETPWSVVWDELSAQLLDSRRPDLLSYLGELALSTACEDRSFSEDVPVEREEWNHLSLRLTSSESKDAAKQRIDQMKAFRAYVYLRDDPLVLADVCKKFRKREEESKDICIEAWSRLYCDLWSCTAKRRFMGRSRISTLVSTIARHVAGKSIHSSNSCAREIHMLDGQELPDPGTGSESDPLQIIIAGETEEALRECAERLPPRLRLVAEATIIDRLPQAQIAEALGISAARISQLVMRARGLIRKCLQEKGLEADI